jgi:hypothetical protein
MISLKRNVIRPALLTFPPPFPFHPTLPSVPHPALPSPYLCLLCSAKLSPTDVSPKFFGLASLVWWYVPWTMWPWALYHDHDDFVRCGVDVSPTDVSPTENSWMLHPWNKASLGHCVPDRCVPTLDRVKHATSSVGRYHGLGRPPAPNGSVGRLAGFAYAPDQVYLIGAPPSDARSAHT